MWSPPQLDSSHSSSLSLTAPIAQGLSPCSCALTFSPASLIFTSLFSTRVFPSEYKHAITSSVLKKKSPLTPPTSLFSYCSISLLALAAKFSDNLLFPLPHLQFFREPVPIKVVFLPPHRNSSCQGRPLLNSVVNAESSC